MTTSKVKEVLFLVFLATIFFLSATPFLDSPGFGGEEAFLVNPAAHIINNNIPIAYHVGTLLGYDFFIMINPWVGPVSAILFIPFLHFFGISIYAIRTTRIIYGFLTIVLLYFFTKDFFNKKIARTASFLLATSTFFIFLYRHGYLDDGILPTFLLLSLICFYRFYKTYISKFLYWGIFFTGLGLSSKISFLWFIGAMIIFCYFFKKRIHLNIRNISISIFIFIFIFAISPLILYNVQNRWLIHTTEGNTLGAILNNLFITYGGVNNIAVYKNILTRFGQLKDIFSTQFQGELITKNSVNFYIFILAILFFLGRLIFFRKIYGQIKINFINILLLLLFFFSCFTLNYLKTEHAAIYLPLCMIIIAKFLEDVFRGKLALARYVILISITALNFFILSSSYNILQKKGFASRQFAWIHPSTAIYALSEYLIANKINNPISIGPELNVNLGILTNGNVRPICLGIVDNPDKTANYLENLFKEQERYYIIPTQTFMEGFLPVFEEMLIRNRKTIDIVKTFYRKDGAVDILLFKIRDGQYNKSIILFE